MVFKLSDSHASPQDPVIHLPCGRCVGCRLKKSKDWAIRCVHETQLHKHSAFVTLTYDSENLPLHNSLKLLDFQKFMRRLRKQNSQKIRFYQAGEYGDENRRPHYHALLFNIEFPNKEFFKKINDIPLYTDKKLTETWGKGFCSIGDVTYKSAAYVARYVMKKATGEHAEQKYNFTDEFGEIHPIEPERATMSRKPGIAAHWFKKYRPDVYPDDHVIIDGKKYSSPAYYDRLLEAVDPQIFSIIKTTRKKSGRARAWDSTPERLAVREELAHIRLDQLPRNLNKAEGNET